MGRWDKSKPRTREGGAGGEKLVPSKGDAEEGTEREVFYKNVSHVMYDVFHLPCLALYFFSNTLRIITIQFQVFICVAPEITPHPSRLAPAPCKLLQMASTSAALIPSRGGWLRNSYFPPSSSQNNRQRHLNVWYHYFCSGYIPDALAPICTGPSAFPFSALPVRGYLLREAFLDQPTKVSTSPPVTSPYPWWNHPTNSIPLFPSSMP